MKKNRFQAGILALIAVLGLPGLGLAGEIDPRPRTAQVESLTITAEKRETRVQDIPASVSVVSDTMAEDFKLDTTLDLIQMVPNLYITNTGNGLASSFASMRGIAGSMAGIPAMGFYVDDVYYTGLDMSLFDIQRVEVLRGPQGSLYGRNSEAGIIHVVTRKPPEELGGSLSLETGSFSRHGVHTWIGGPVTDTSLRFRAALRYMETDGYFENRFDNTDDAGRMENLDSRLSLAFTPSDRLDMDLTYDIQRYDSPKYANFSPLNEGEMRTNINVDEAGNSHKKADGGALRIRFQMDGMKLVSVTSARKEDFLFANDVDFTPMDIMTMAVARETRSLSQEIRLVSDRKESDVKWLAGLFLLDEADEGQFDMGMNLGAMGMPMGKEVMTQNSRTDTRGVALFGETTWTFMDRLDLTLGLRYDRESKDFSFIHHPVAAMGQPRIQGNAEETFDAWLPKVSLAYGVSESIRPYATISRGFRSGGFNDKERVKPAFKPEFTWNYELGLKTQWLDNRLRINAALFYIDWSDMQVEVLTRGGTLVYTDNAGQATSKGAELEIAARPLPGLELMAGAAYTDAVYDDYRRGSQVFDGKRVIDSPKYTLNLGATFRMENGIFLNAAYARYGDICYDPANTRSQEDYGLANAKIGYETPWGDLYVYGKNLFDAAYATRAFEVNKAWFGRAGAPREIGVMVTGRF